MKISRGALVITNSEAEQFLSDILGTDAEGF